MTINKCDACKKEVALDGEDKKTIERIISGIGDVSYLAEIQKDKIWQPVGCPKCNNLGYKGRIGVFEAILVDEKIEKVVLENPSERDIFEVAKPQGLLTLAQDGVIKILQGLTTIEELDRVVDLSQ